jgi:hypothetical protein
LCEDYYRFRDMQSDAGTRSHNSACTPEQVLFPADTTGRQVFLAYMRVVLTFGTAWTCESVEEEWCFVSMLVCHRLELWVQKFR